MDRPVNKPLHGFDGDYAANYGPIHEPSLDIRLAGGALRKGFVGFITRI